MEIEILGTFYTLHRGGREDPRFANGIMGRCDSYLKELSVRDVSEIYSGGEENGWKPKKWCLLQEEEALHHEIVHAYLNESGLKGHSGYASNWAWNETMIDWIAIMGEKIADSFKEADQWLVQFYVGRKDS